MPASELTGSPDRSPRGVGRCRGRASHWPGVAVYGDLGETGRRNGSARRRGSEQRADTGASALRAGATSYQSVTPGAVQLSAYRLKGRPRRQIHGQRDQPAQVECPGKPFADSLSRGVEVRDHERAGGLVGALAACSDRVKRPAGRPYQLLRERLRPTRATPRKRQSSLHGPGHRGHAGMIGDGGSRLIQSGGCPGGCPGGGERQLRCMHRLVR